MQKLEQQVDEGGWLRTRYLTIHNEGKLLHCIFSPIDNMTLDIARSCVQHRLVFSDGVSYPCLIDMRDLQSVTKEAREYMAVEGAQLITAGALLIGSPATRMIANIFLMVNKPPVPTRMFTDESAARKWLNTFCK